MSDNGTSAVSAQRHRKKRFRSANEHFNDGRDYALRIDHVCGGAIMTDLTANPQAEGSNELTQGARGESQKKLLKDFRRTSRATVVRRQLLSGYDENDLEAYHFKVRR